MILPFFNVYLKEWSRNGGYKRYIQLFLILIIPCIIYFFSIFLPSLMSNNQNFPIFYAGFFVFIAVGVYSMLISIEGEHTVIDDFPTEYLPVKKSHAMFFNMFFIFILSILSIYISFVFSAVISLKFLSHILLEIDAENLVKFSLPIFIGIIYTVFSGVVFGSFIGIAGKRLIDFLNPSNKKFFMIIYMLIIIIVFRKYFEKVFEGMPVLENIFVFSPAYWSNSLSLLIINNINMLSFFAGLLFNAVLIFCFMLLTDKKTKPLNLKFINSDFNTILSFKFPLYTLLVKRWFSTSMTIISLLWAVLLVLEYFLKTNFIIFIMGALFYVFTFLCIDRMFPGKNEDYKKIWDKLPVSVNTQEGAMLLFYYLFFLLPVALYFILNSQTMGITGFNQAFPNTLTGFILKNFPYISIASIIPFFVFLYPFILSSNKRGGKTGKREVIGGIFVLYLLFSGIFMAGIIYVQAPEFRTFINGLFYQNGYFIFKTIFYLFSSLVLFIHIRALFLIVLSIYNIFVENKICVEK